MTALNTYVIRCRGLPWSCTEDDLRQFFCGANAGDEIVKLCMTVNEVGKPTGEAYIQFATEAQLQNAMKKNHECIGKRYVEIFRSTLKELEFVMHHNSKEAAASRKRSGITSLLDNQDMIVRLRGLPFGVWPDDLYNFFEGLDIIQDGIYIVNEKSRQTGDAFVQFGNADSYEKALMKDRETVGHRYVEVFPSSYDEVNRFKRKYETGGDDFRSDYDDYGMGGKSKHGKFGRGGGGGYRDLFDDFDDSDFGSRGGAFGRGGMQGGGFGRSPMYGNGGGMGSSMMGAGSYMPTGYPMREAFGGQRLIGAPIGSGFGGGGSAMSAVAPFASNNNGNGMPYTNFEASGGRQGGGKPVAGGKPLKHYVFLRGLPPKCGHEDIVEFFTPLRIRGVQFTFDSMGRPSGEARVEFFTHVDAQDAMNRDRRILNGQTVLLAIHSETSDDEPVAPYPNPINKKGPRDHFGPPSYLSSMASIGYNADYSSNNF